MPWKWTEFKPDGSVDESHDAEVELSATGGRLDVNIATGEVWTGTWAAGKVRLVSDGTSLDGDGDPVCGIQLMSKAHGTFELKWIGPLPAEMASAFGIRRVLPIESAPLKAESAD
ncbi:unnamed protein product [Polarella glacialis]|uniref:Uncharacterized protein n=1 Tax=Polarella glacialis TaxID=89957 RepID=A0A813GX64_POLGL|nr:unnamed protein product [Polarella glacialis]CAE8640320.1 unnamed protein product [Polarella glacialis]